MIEATRIQFLNDKPEQTGSYVLYWMQQSQRSEYNHALEYATREANRLRLPLLVVFGLTGDYPDSNLRHYTFMLEGLQETEAALCTRGIRFVVRIGSPETIALAFAEAASLIVCDRGYLRHQRIWRQTVATHVHCRVVQVESDVVVPVDAVSNKAEYAARTIRPKIQRQVFDCRHPFRSTSVTCESLGMDIVGESLKSISKLAAKLRLDQSVGPVSRFFKGGTREAKKRLRRFLKNELKNYIINSNQPQTDCISHMSPYLHFGHISPLYILHEVKKAGLEFPDAADAFLEQLIVRRELAINFVEFTPDYDRYNCLPDWAQTTLAQHAIDPRPYLYGRKELEAVETHDPYWNAAMNEMKATGFMHNYMRMYWGKKILEWSNTPQKAYETTRDLNNRYFLDGRDPNSYAGIAWIFGKHDRPWGQREIFGSVRYMAASGLRRKCDIDAYVKKVNKRMVENYRK